MAIVRGFSDPTSGRSSLPFTLMEDARRSSDTSPTKAAIKGQPAVAIGILTYAPIRLQNLISIRLEENLSRTNGAGDRLLAAIPRPRRERPAGSRMSKRSCAERAPARKILAHGRKRGAGRGGPGPDVRGLLGKIRISRSRRIFRNGLSIALLAVCSTRVGSFASLTLGHSFLRIDDGWWIRLAANETKSGRPDERPTPAFLTSCVDEYLRSYRPRFLCAVGSDR
jgi:hypothetical protein